jgi:hypothetical protein
MHALLGLGTTLPSCLVTLVTVIYCHILNSDAPEIDTIQTWTCKYKNSHPYEQDIPLPSNMGNKDFGSLCTQSVSVFFLEFAYHVLTETEICALWDPYLVFVAGCEYGGDDCDVVGG